MMKKVKRLFTLMLALVMMMTSAFGANMDVYAGGVEEEGTAGGTIQNATVMNEFEEDGYYPASLEYVLRSLVLNVDYADETSDTVRWWEPDDWSEDYRYFAWTNSGMDCYNIRFYDAEGNQVKITSKHVPIGEFTLKINRNEEEPFYETTIKILDPVSGTAGKNSASFSGEDNTKVEELWYEFAPEADKLYIYSPSEEWSSSSGFSGIWIKNDDNTVSCLCKGMGMYGENYENFSYTADGENTLYMVIGEAQATNFSGTMTWNEKKEVVSLKLNPAASYKAWDRDIDKVPLTITYGDGTTEVIDEWISTSCLEEEIGDETNYIYVKGFYAKTSNADTIYLGACEDGTWVDASTSRNWKPGKETWKAYLQSDPSKSASALITIASPTVNSLIFADGKSTNFSVSSGNEVYYTVAPDCAGQLELVKTESGNVTVYVHKKQSGFWKSTQSFILANGISTKVSVVEDCEYLVVFTSSGTCSGTIGKYIKGTAKSATVDVASVDASDYTVWGKLPITVNFVASDGVTKVGSQTLSSWDMDYYNSGMGYATDKYNETIYYVLYNGSTKVDIPVLSAEMEEMLGGIDDPEELDMILMELGFPGGADCLVVPAGNYTVKVYLNSISDSTVIGSGTLKVTNGAECTEHSWNKGTVTKKATLSASGTKKYTCTACGETKTSTIAKISSVSLSAEKFTYTGNKITPTVTVKNSKGTKLVNGTDYTVTFGSSTRTKVGRYSVTVKFKNSYSGEKKLWFTVVPKAPSKVTAQLYGYDDVKVSWSKCTGASGYAVYYKKGSSGEYSLLGRTTNSSLKTGDKVNLSDGSKYYFKVVPYYKSSSGTRYSALKYTTNSVYTLKKLSTPTVKKSDSKVKVVWNNISGETGYQISKSTSSTKTNIVLTKKTTSGTSATISATKGKKYYYKVRAYKVIDDKGTKVYGPWSKVASFKR